MTKAMTLGDRVKARRTELQLSMNDLVEAGIGKGTIVEIESGKNTNPKLEALRSLATGLKWSLSELLEGTAASAVRMIPLVELYDDPDNPRQVELADAEKDSLIASIRSQGLILPLAVRQVQSDGGEGPLWAVVDGHQRLMALRAVHGAKSKTLVPCRVVEADDNGALLMALTANLQRNDMNAIDIASAVGNLVKAKVSTKAIAEATGYKIRWVQDMAAIDAHLDERAKDFLRSGHIKVSQATALASQRNKHLQTALLEMVLAEGWNEDRIREEIKGTKPQQAAMDLGGASETREGEGQSGTAPAAKPSGTQPAAPAPSRVAAAPAPGRQAEKPAKEKPSELPELKELVVPPAWAATMAKDHFVVHGGSGAILCKGWRQMAAVLHRVAATDSWAVDAVHNLHERDEWDSDAEGLPFSVEETVYRITEFGDAT